MAIMKGPVAARKRRRSRPLRCHIVDDHCDALSKIHGAIREGALPFTGLSVLHFDAHPDLMVTPDMPAATCFRPRELYDTLASAEGGIAEWILPMVYQGHLSKLWWIRPPWARQFSDGVQRFCVGQVKATGNLRVSSTAPYFVDDRLHCPEEDMQDCKPLHLCVSLVPDELLTPAVELQKNKTEFPTNIGRLRNPPAQSTHRVGIEPDMNTTDEEKAASREVVAHGDGGSVVHGPASEAREATPAEQPPDRPASSDNAQPTPWVLDICLDFFTTENPFMAELEGHIGKEDAALVRDFYEKPRFRGAATSLPHSTQLDHERIFRTEVNRLLRTTSTTAGKEDVAVGGTEGDVGGAENPDAAPAADVRSGSAVAMGDSTAAAVSLGSDGGPRAESSTRCPRENAANGMVASIGSEEEEAGKEEDEADHREDTSSSSRTADGVFCVLDRLEELFEPDGEDRRLPRRFASIVDRIGREGRETVAWTDHCACLPRYLATHQEVEASVRTVEAFLRSLLLKGATAATDGSTSTSSNSSNNSCSIVGWNGRPGVITVARSEEDGYVPTEMVAFIEREVLAMLFRLYGDEDGDNNPQEGGVVGGGSLEVCYEEGLEPIPVSAGST